MKDYYHDTMTKASGRVDKDVYNRVTKALHYGQVTLLIQCVFTSLDHMILNGDLDKIIQYLYGTNDLTLQANKEDKDDL